MSIIEAVLFGIIEGVTEFLPVSSTGHLTIAEKLTGFNIADPAVTAFTAIIQVGAVLATVLYFRADLLRIVRAWLRGLTGEKTADSRFGWAIILGSVPIAIVGLLFKDQIETSVRSLWIVAFALIGWSGVMYIADRAAKQIKHEKDVSFSDTLIIGAVQCLALIPGVSRSGATMSAGLFRGFDRVTVTKLSFFLSIPALLAAGALEVVTKSDEIASGFGWAPTLIATAVSFGVAYVSVAWLLKFVAHHSYQVFIIYRVVVGFILIALLGLKVITPQ